MQVERAYSYFLIRNLLNHLRRMPKSMSCRTASSVVMAEGAHWVSLEIFDYDSTESGISH